MNGRPALAIICDATFDRQICWTSVCTVYWFVTSTLMSSTTLSLKSSSAAMCIYVPAYSIFPSSSMYWVLNVENIHSGTNLSVTELLQFFLCTLPPKGQSSALVLKVKPSSPAYSWVFNAVDSTTCLPQIQTVLTHSGCDTFVDA